MENKELVKYLKSLQKTIKNKKIPYPTMSSWNRQVYEGYNQGLSEITKIIERKLKKETNDITNK